MKRRVFITGGGSGIGLEIARRFANAGDDVLIAGRQAARLKETGLAFVEMDVTDEASVKAGFAKAGRIDVFVANAGAAESAPALKTSKALWDSMLAVNLTGVFLCAREAAAQMVERKAGRIIVIASTASLKGYAYVSAYAAAKHGALGLVRSLAIELAKTGVTVNAICPGFTDTDLVMRSLDTIAAKTGRSKEDALKSLVKDNPQGRLVSPAEVAAAALWLASDEAAAVNGQSIVIDGGEVIS
jgi:NAD(P)-dependent dehydrogenase (short-subunit alcohol dehydrogenase family)